MRYLPQSWVMGGAGAACLAGAFLGWLGAGQPLAHAGTPPEEPDSIQEVESDSALEAPAGAVSRSTPEVPQAQPAPAAHRPQAAEPIHAVSPDRGMAAPRPERRANPTLPRCEGDLRLVGSVMNETWPQLSMAVVSQPRGTGVVKVGGRIGALTLVAVGPLGAHLQTSQGELCRLSIFSLRGDRSAAHEPVKPKASPTPLPPKMEVVPKGQPMFTQQELHHGVRKLPSGSYVISRELFLRGLSNPGAAAGGAWFRPSKRDDETIGMEVRRVRDGSTLHAMGIQTGDVIRNVNGHALDTPAGLLGALRSARESDSVTLAVVRDGHERPIHYLVD